MRVSSKVLLLAKRASNNFCTSGSKCSPRDTNPLSDLENANVFLPVVGLIFVGGSTSRLSSSLANLGLLIRSSLSTPAASSRDALYSRISVRCFFNSSVSKPSTGSMNIRNVRSISFSSFLGKFLPRTLNRSYVRFTSFIQ